MSNYSNNIMNSIDILTQSALRKLKYDITIKAIVKTIVDVKTGEYKVLYEGNLLSAFAKDDKTAYDINDTVYVKVSEGDFDNKLIIDYKLRGSDLSASEVDELRNSMFEVSDNLLSVTNEFGIISGVTEQVTLKIKVEDGTDKNIQIEDLSYYSNKYEYVKLKATFRTQFFKTFVKGNYGLEFIFNGKDTDKYSYKLDSTDFNGNPYYLVNNTKQDIIIQIPTSKIKGLESINLYQNIDKDYYASDSASILAIVNKDENKRSEIEKNNFQYYCERIAYTIKAKNEKDNTTADDIKKDIEINKEKSKYITNQDENAYNIFVKDIKLFFMEKVDLFNLPYYFRVKALQGNDCAERDLHFDPQLLSNGAEVSSNSTITWYEQDLTVDVASDNYDRAAGVGWKKIQKTVADPNSEAEPCIYNNSLYVPQKSIPQIKRFKVIATYDKSTFDKVIEVVNSKAVNSYSLVYENDKLKVQNAADKTIAWYYVVGTSTFAKIDNSTDTLLLDNYAKYINVKFYCVVEDVADNTILEYDYTNEIVEEISVTYDGTSMFKYDASGKIDDTIYSSEYALTAKVVFQNGLSDKQYDIKWYTPDGNELSASDQKHEVNNSMITQVRLDTKNSIRYNISSYYKQDSNNTFKIKIITADKEYSFEKEITFIKDGDQGTNGSACALIIKPVDGREYLYHNTKDNAKSKGLRLKVYLYNVKDNTSEDITKDLDTEKIKTYNLNCNYKETKATSGEITDRTIHVDYVKDSENEDYCYIKITYSVATGPDIILCYPIDVVINNTEDKKPALDIAKYIKYDALGMNPICRKEILGYNNETITIMGTGTDADKKKLVVDKGYLSPNSHFPFDNTEGFLALKYDDVIHTIYFYKNSYGSTAINNWDGQKVHISDEKDKEQYILAPLIGAGTKSNNKFTGVVMGYDSSQGMGLYGYKDGTSSFGFKTDGTGYIGAQESGRISFDGKNAVIYGGLNKNGAKSMTLNLYNDTDKFNENTLAIDIKDDSGDSTFSVNYGGKLKSTSGTIGGWNISETQLKGGNTTLSSNGTIITNNLTANVGCKIGSWLIDDNGLRPEKYNNKDFSSMVSQVSGKYNIFIDNIIFAYKTENDSYNLGSYIGYRQNKSILDICGGPISTVRIYGTSEGAHLSFKDDKMKCTYSAENQEGIYARFAD